MMTQMSLDFYNQKKRNYKDLNSILVTGTKGKTSVSLMLNHLFNFAKKTTLYVSTSGVYQNQKQIFNYKNSIDQLGVSPTVMPGRYIYHFLQNGFKLKDFTAIFEASLSCGVYGTGMHEHKVGALLNIYSDHVGNGLMHNRQDLYQMKSFIFNNLAKHGYYIANLDNDLSRRSLTEQILLDKKIHKLAFTNLSITHQRAKNLMIKWALSDLFYIQNTQIYSVRKGLIYNFTDFPYLQVFQSNQALKANLLAFLAIATIFFKQDLIDEALNNFRFPSEFGRMMVFENQMNTQRVIVDYAHEPVSLQLMIKNLYTVYQEKPYLITRAATHRTNASIGKLSDAIAKFDLAGLTIYDLMSTRDCEVMNFSEFERHKGEVAQLMKNQLQKRNTTFSYQIIPKETDALKEALDSGKKLILHIRGDMESLETFINKYGLRRVL